MSYLCIKCWKQIDEGNYGGGREPERGMCVPCAVSIITGEDMSLCKPCEQKGLTITATRLVGPSRISMCSLCWKYQNEGVRSSGAVVIEEGEVKSGLPLLPATIATTAPKPVLRTHGVEKVPLCRCGKPLHHQGACPGFALGSYKEPQRIKAKELLEGGASIRSTMKETGLAKGTVESVRKESNLPELCTCGRKNGHKGWCPDRVKKSESRQKFLDEKFKGVGGKKYNYVNLKELVQSLLKEREELDKKIEAVKQVAEMLNVEI